MAKSMKKIGPKGFTYTDFFGTKYHFTYNPSDGYWWNDEMKGDLFAITRDAMYGYEAAGKIAWDDEEV